MKRKTQDTTVISSGLSLVLREREDRPLPVLAYISLRQAQVSLFVLPPFFKKLVIKTEEPKA